MLKLCWWFIVSLFALLPTGSCVEAADSKSWPRILAVGDSITEGYGLTSAEAWPALVEAKLRQDGFPQVKMINAGSSGATTAFGLRTLKFHLKRLQPDLVIYALGSNDGLRGHKIPQIETNIKEALTLLGTYKVPVIIAGLKSPPNYGPKYFKEFESLFPRLASEFKVPLIPFLLKDVAGIPKYNQGDGIHPTASGYKIVAQTVYPFIKAALKKQKSP